MLRTRVITALVAIPLIIFLVFAGGWWFFAGISFVAVLAGWEFVRMMKQGGYLPNRFLLLPLILALLLDAQLSLGWPDYIISLAVVATLVWQLFQPHSKTPMADWALTMGGLFYVGWSLAHLVALRQLANGLAWVWLALLVTWGADSFAYLVGSTWGRHKVWPRLSPKKSWEGLLGSVVGGLLAASLIVMVFGLRWGPSLLLGAILPIVAFFGDIVESMMKRDVGVKDSSNLLPGHGGVLDRIDSLLLVNIVCYYCAIWTQ